MARNNAKTRTTTVPGVLADPVGGQPVDVYCEDTEAVFRSLYAEHGPPPLRLATTLTGGDSPGPWPPLTARVSSGRVELDVIDRGPGVREAGAVITISISTLARLVEEQASSRLVEAALRRVAKLVAREAPTDELFAAVTEEVGRLLQAGQTTMIRYESDGTATLVAAWSKSGDTVPLGAPERLGGNSLIAAVWQTRHQVRIGSYPAASGGTGMVAREAGFRSAVAAPIIVQGRLWGVMIAGPAEEQSLGPETEARLASFTELVATAISNAENLAELTASRARVVAAADETRRRIERDLHDGAQQRLLSLALALRSAQTEIPPELGQLTEALAEIADGLVSVQDDLREMAHGIHPAILVQDGLKSALKTLARRCAVPVELDLRAGAPLPERVGVAAYYVAAEALTNAVKHARASVVHLETESAGGALQLWIRDDGAGGADPGRGSGLVGLKDRVEALGGSIIVHSPSGAGTTVHARLPLAS